MTVVLCLLGQPTSFYCLQKRKKKSFIKNKNFLMQRGACMSDLGLKYATFVEFPSAPEVPLMGAWHI